MHPTFKYVSRSGNLCNLLEDTWITQCLSGFLLFDYKPLEEWKLLYTSL